MRGEPELPADWNEPEKWVWKRIAAGEIADLNARDRDKDPEFKDLDPRTDAGWADHRRLRAKFLQTILTRREFVDATPYGGVRILGALVDDAPLDLEHARLPRLFWLEKSRILVDVKARNMRVDGDFSLERSYVAGEVILYQVEIREGLYLVAGQYDGGINLTGAAINGPAFFQNGASFIGGVTLVGATIGSMLEMRGSTRAYPVNTDTHYM